MAISYKDSGVDVTRGNKAVELMKKHVKSTYDNNVIGDLGSFGGFYSIAGEMMEEPVDLGVNKFEHKISENVGN